MPLDPLTAGAAAAAWLWDKYGKDISDKAKGELKDRWKRFHWNGAAQAYRNKVAELYGTIRILGKPEPVALEGIFTDVFILDRPTAFRRYDITQLREDPKWIERDVTRIRGLDLVKHTESRRLFILGKPGAGKTTFLKYVALQAVQGKLGRVPIFVSLKECADSKEWADSDEALMPFLVRQFEICNFPDSQAFIEQLLKKGNAIVLFDGLDEVSTGEQQRDKLTAALRDFSKQYDRCQCLMTCRIAATNYTFERFTYVELADFSDEQITTFVTKWFQDSEVKREMFLRDFAKDEQRGLRELASSPLLLSLRCLSFDATLTFPQRRVEIYEEALEALLKKWDASRGIKRDDLYRELSLGRKRQMFARTAYETFVRSHYFVRQEELAKLIEDYMRKLPTTKPDDEIDGEAVLKAIEAQHGILGERAHHIYSFSHLTFQEYFTAKYIVDNALSGTLSNLLTPEHVTDARWREVILLTASLLDNADHFVKLFITSMNDFVGSDGLLLRFLEWANTKANSIHPGYHGMAVRAFYLARTLVHVRELSRALDVALARAFDRYLDDLMTVALSHAFDLARDMEHDTTFGSIVHIAHSRAQEINTIQGNMFSEDLYLDSVLLTTLQIASIVCQTRFFDAYYKVRKQFTALFAQINELAGVGGLTELQV